MSHATDTRIATARLLLRPPESTDIDAIVPLANNLRVTAMTSRMPHPYGREDAQAWLDSMADDEAGERTFAITARSDGTFMGACGLGHARDLSASAADALEIGYWLGEPFWGQGFATEAAQAVLDLAFTDPTITLVVAGARPSNPASRRVLEKCGFRPSGQKSMPCRALDHEVTCDRFRLTREEWTSRKRTDGLEQA